LLREKRKMRIALEFTWDLKVTQDSDFVTPKKELRLKSRPVFELVLELISQNAVKF
jgi:hypothetical protein